MALIVEAPSSTLQIPTEGYSRLMIFLAGDMSRTPFNWTFIKRYRCCKCVGKYKFPMLLKLSTEQAAPFLRTNLQKRRQCCLLHFDFLFFCFSRFNCLKNKGLCALRRTYLGVLSDGFGSFARQIWGGSRTDLGCLDGFGVHGWLVLAANLTDLGVRAVFLHIPPDRFGVSFAANHSVLTWRGIVSNLNVFFNLFYIPIF